MLYQAYNGPMQTTGVFAGVTTGTSVKTLLQLASPSSPANPIRVKAWGISFNGSSVATPIQCELIETGAVAATVTAHVAAGMQPYDAEAQGIASVLTLGTAASGYTATAEGTITATRFGDLQYVPPSAGYQYEWSLKDEFYVPSGRFLRVRVLAAAAVNAVCWVRWAE